MHFSDYIIAALILLGAFIMLLSASYTQKIFNTLPDSQLQGNWKKLRILMLVFLVGYLAVATVVILGQTHLLAFLSGVIFLMGSLFVFLVVRTGLDSFKRLKELNENLDDTELKNKELEQFAYITSHDLKTPIRGISSLADFIKEDLEAGETEDVYGHLDMMQGRVKRLESLIDGILHYSKIGKINPEAVDMNTMIRGEAKNYTDPTKVKFIKKDTLPVLNGDKIQLSQVVSNLVSNAVKYNDKDVCEITISSTETSEAYKITFADNGPGIAPKYHQKIFEVFQTLDEKNNNESTGLGLSIVKKILEKHQGSIRVESDGEFGTSFIIAYPKELKR
ncbi:phytochrome-like protein cph1 [Kordia sp. SMS9]|uniref:sensor histidine kinase n=1 Tax=Kordia sp. SMS9 TaxID=2282170 RepID=UPI000E0CCF2C|nr:ATP-binding protein [Kordia sp. SMS9]AXG69434.1 phytochrome-like protein cph1 [Kordia sp. SMS9]